MNEKEEYIQEVYNFFKRTKNKDIYFENEDVYKNLYIDSPNHFISIIINLDSEGSFEIDDKENEYYIEVNDKNLYNKFINLIIYNKQFDIQWDDFEIPYSSYDCKIEESEIIDDFIKNYHPSWKGRYYRKSIKGEYFGFNFNTFAILFDLEWKYAKVLINDLHIHFIVNFTPEQKEKLQSLAFSKFVTTSLKEIIEKVKSYV